MFTFTAELWRWEGDGAAWHFVALPEDVSDEIEHRTVGLRRGFGSVKVRVTVGVTIWSTSVFPDKSRETFILPIKKMVRTKAKIEAGDSFELTLDLVDF